MNTKLLLVEPSATMRYVLEEYVQSLGYEVEAIENYDRAKNALNEQFRAFEGDFAGVLFGWPAVPDETADSLAQMLEQAEFIDLPVVVMSTDMRSSTRAWVSGRESTSLLSWKEYQAVEGQLSRLLTTSSDVESELNPKFDNSDIHLLIVDDSISIRHALRDMFELQGYQVSMAATHDEAIELAHRTPMDLAILDFYLEDGTGDVLCRELTHDPAAGSITCAMLTGTYSDHIIKRSLRAGAVECMFKNESSELILSRVDALSRLIRQRKALYSSRTSLNKIVDTVAGATLLIDAANKISYVSPKALALIQQTSDENMLGASITDFLDAASYAGEIDRWHNSQWMRGEEAGITLHFRKQGVGIANEVLLYLKPGLLDAVTPELVASDADLTSILQYTQGKDFVECLGEYMMQPVGPDSSVSLLVIEVSNHDQDLTDDDYQQIEQELLEIYRKPKHMSQLAHNRYGFILRHENLSQSYLMTRKLMLVCNNIELPEHGQALESTGCLIALANNAALSSSELLQRVSMGLDVVSKQGSNQALLLDVQKMLPVYPANGTP